MSSETTKRAQAKIQRWKRDPVYFVTEELKAQPDPWQLEALRSFPDPDAQRIALQACAGPGKSAVLAWCGWNFLSCYAAPGEHPKGAAVSITRENLKDNLWAELLKWQGRSEFLMRAFVGMKERIYAADHPDTWFLSARSWNKSATAEEQGRTLSGLHSKFVCYLIDESGDIPLAVIKAAEQGLSNCTFGKILQAGNPTSHEGVLYAAATQLAHLWRVIRITGDPEDPHRSSRIDIAWAEEQIRTYGRDNPWVMAYILGKFPPASLNALLGPDEVAVAMARAPREDAFARAQKRIGVDVARFGDDSSVLTPRQGIMVYPMVELRNADNPTLAARVLKAKGDWGSELEFIDATGGFGSGVIDFLIQAGESPVAVNVSETASDPRYFNKRSEIHFLMAEWVKRGGALPNDPQLARELVAPTYTLHKGKLRVEEKELVKKKLNGKSPDRSDSLSLTFALPEMPASSHAYGLTREHATPGKVLHEYDPFSPDRM